MRYVSPMTRHRLGNERLINLLFDIEQNKESSFYEEVYKFDDSSLKLDVDLPGFAKEEVKVSIKNDVMTVCAEKKSEKPDVKTEPVLAKKTQNGLRKKQKSPLEGNSQKTLQKPIKRKSISRKWKLPENVDIEKISVKMEYGVLSFDMPLKTSSLDYEIQVS